MPQEVHHYDSLEGEHGGLGGMVVAVGVLAQERVAQPVPFIPNTPEQTDQSL